MNETHRDSGRDVAEPLTGYVVVSFSPLHGEAPTVQLFYFAEPSSEVLPVAPGAGTLYFALIPAALISAESATLEATCTGATIDDPAQVDLLRSTVIEFGSPEFVQSNPFGIEVAWARTVSRMIENLSGVRADIDRISATRLSRAIFVTHRYVTDPRLSPALIARALNISRRTLYLLSQQELGGIAGYIRDVRLEHALDVLLDPARRHDGLAGLAAVSGFGTLQQLNRATMMAFGVSAAQIRRTGIRPVQLDLASAPIGF